MMACRAVVSPRHHLPTRLGQEPLLLLAPARQAQRATASNRRRVLRCSATAAPPEHATAVETPQEVATPAKMVRVPNPVQLLTDGQLPMTSMEMTVEEDVGKFVLESIEQLREMKLQGSVLGEAVDQGLMPKGLVGEFGVYRGASLRQLGESLPGREVFGFDSFEGFPTDWEIGEGVYKTTVEKEVFAVDGDEALYDLPSNVSLVKGFFSDSMPGFLAARPDEPFALMHIDCDMYTSTRDIFAAAEDRIVPGTVLVFDEFWAPGADGRGEFTAFFEWAQRTGRKWEFIGWGEGSHGLMLRLPKWGESKFAYKLGTGLTFRLFAALKGTVNYDSAVALRITE